MITTLLLAALLQAGGPHFSEDPDAVATPGASRVAPPVAAAAPVKVVASPASQMLAQENKEDPISCQTFETTGTRFTTQRCYRKSQWDQMARDGKDTYQSWQQGPAVTGAH